jgi:hypothetical protein
LSRLREVVEAVPDYVPKYGIGAEQRRNVLKRAAEAGRKFDPRIEAAIVKVDGRYELASTLEALQYETVEEMKAIIKRGEGQSDKVYGSDRPLADRAKAILAKY